MTICEGFPINVKINVKQIFERYRNNPWIFVRPLGNWGDHLIYAGAEKVANDVGLQWRSCETEEFRQATITANHCIYLHGGGGYNSWSSGRAITNLELALAKPAHTVVQGPISTDGDREWLAKRLASALSDIHCGEFIIFARETKTLGLLKELNFRELDAAIHLDHDTALALEAKDLLAIAGLSSMPVGNYNLVVLREDNEQPQPATTASGPVAAQNTNRAVPTTGIALDPAYQAKSFAHWVRIHLFARTISTNRLHSAIIGCIANKPVFIGPGSYHKNQAVWEHSLKSRNVQWIDTIKPPRTVFWPLLPHWIRNSHKVQQLRLACWRAPLQ